MYLQRNTVVAVLTTILMGCAHAAIVAHLETIPGTVIVTAVTFLAIMIVIVLNIVSAVTPRTSWLFGIIAALDTLVIAACRDLAMDANSDDVPAIVIITAGIVAAVSTAAQIADDLEHENLVLVAPFVVELVALTRLFTTGAYDGIVIGCGVCALVALTPLVLTPTPAHVEVREP